MTNHIFQPSRCWYLMKKQLFDNKKWMFKCLFLFFVILLLLKLYNFSNFLELHNLNEYIGPHNINHYLELSWFRRFLMDEMRSLIMLFYVFIIYITVKTFSLSNKQKRINYLLIPVSSMERYISTLAIVFLYVFCLIGIALLSELSRIGLCIVFYPESEIMFVNPFRILSVTEVSQRFYWYSGSCYVVLFISFICVCGTCKKSVLLNATVCFFLSMFLFMILFGLISTDVSIEKMISDFQGVLRIFYRNGILNGLPIVSVWIGLNLILSYFRLKRAQIA